MRLLRYWRKNERQSFLRRAAEGQSIDETDSTSSFNEQDRIFDVCHLTPRMRDRWAHVRGAWKCWQDYRRTLKTIRGASWR